MEDVGGRKWRRYEGRRQWRKREGVLVDGLRWRWGWRWREWRRNSRAAGDREGGGKASTWRWWRGGGGGELISMEVGVAMERVAEKIWGSR